jgi:anti-anti-sigma regulatory factor
MEIREINPQTQLPITVLQPVGSVHLGNADQLETTARTAIANGTRALVLDLTEVPTMTSAGLRVLHLLYRLLEGGAPGEAAQSAERPRSNGKSQRFKLVNPSPALGKVLGIAGFDTFLEIHDTLQGAIEALEAGML